MQRQQRGWQQRGPSDRPVTDRQLEIIALIALGYSNVEIGTILYISPETVKTHIRKSLAILEARTRAELVYRAIQDGLLLVTPSPAVTRTRSRGSTGRPVSEWNGSPEELLSSLMKD